jgi:serine/threonine protein kinase
VDLTSKELWERIHRSGLASQDTCRTWAKELTPPTAKASRDDAMQLATDLIRTAKLTTFQLNSLLEPTPRPLALGPYRIVDTLSDLLGPNWVQATDIHRGTALWCIQWTREDLQRPTFKTWPPSVDLARQHSRIEGPALDRWESVLAEPGYLACFCEAMQGQSLAQSLTQGPLSVESSVRMMRDMVSAIVGLHDQDLIHGAITPESIWKCNDELFRLRRDPIMPPQSPYSASWNSVMTMPEILRHAAAAPEFTLPGTEPSQQTDLYALGVVWAQALLGRIPWPNSDRLDANGWKKTHQQTPIELPANCPEPIARCIRYLVGKNISSRFRDASQLVKAIESLEGARPARFDKELVVAPTTKPEPAVKTEQPSAPTPNVAAPTLAAQPEKTSNVVAAQPEKTSNAKPAEPVKPSEPKKPATPAIPAAKPLTTTSQPAATATPKDAPKPTTPKQPNIPTQQPLQELTQPAKPIEQTAISQARPKAALPKAATTKPPAARTGKKKKKKKPVWLLPSIAIGSIAVFGGLLAILLNGSGSTKVAKKEPQIEYVERDPSTDKSKSSSSNSGDQKSSVTTDPVAEFFAIGGDDGQTLWAPPFAGNALSVELLPPGAEAIVFLSRSSWNGKENLAKVQSWLTESLPSWKAFAGSIPFASDDRIQDVAIALFPSKTPGVPEAVFRFGLKEAETIEALLPTLAGYTPKGIGTDRQMWSDGKLGVVFDNLTKDTKLKTRRLTIGLAHQLDSMADTLGGAVPLRRQLDVLLQNTDSRSDFTLVAAPSFLLGDARELWNSAPLSAIVLRTILNDEVQGVSLSSSFQPKLYSELRLVLSDPKNAGKRSSELRESLEQLPNKLEASFVNSPAPTYWRAIAARFPQMVRSVAKNSRFGIEDGQIVANVYLPSDSLSNLVVGSWMSLQNPMTNIASTIPSNPSTSVVTKTVDQMLDSPMNIAFEQESLEMGLAAIATEFNDSVLKNQSSLRMSINGTAFQKEGITQNQQVRNFAQKGVALRTVLTDLVRRANPVTTVQSPTEKDQKVVWVVLDDPENSGGKKIELTTRTWATDNKVTLPKEFGN